ncbi:MAG: glycosyltransferase family 39 protein [Proteobacteria bacterium]|nr:glycosyltransferase family 39 protein [Pseudomonadota bacterium]
MTFLLGASLLISLAIGGMLVSLLVSHRMRSAGEIAFLLIAGGGLGLGVSSCVYFVCLAAGMAGYAWVIDLILCLILGVLCFARFRKGTRGGPPPLPKTQPFTGFQILLASILSLEIIASLVSFFVAFLKEPHGRWDAWLIWNMHARFLFRSSEEWRAVFASGLDWSHWDYPLLLPLAIVRSWGYMGGESGNIPAVFAFVFTVLVVGLLLSSLSLLRGRTEGILAAMVLLGTPFFIMMGASQFADVPFAFFILITIVMLFLQSRSPENHAGPTILAGLAAGLCAWTKNEGLLFLLVATAGMAGSAAYAGGWKHSFKRTAWFLAGALPALLPVLYFKLRLSPVNDLVAGFSLAAASAKLLDWGRYAEIAKAFFITGISFTQGLIDVRVGMKLNPGAVNILLLAVYLMLTGIRIGEKDRAAFFQAAAVLLLMPVGYFFVYVMTPLDLYYHLATSLNRLFLQLWPGAVFLFFMAAAAPGQASLPGDKTETVKSLQSRPKPAKGKNRYGR